MYGKKVAVIEELKKGHFSFLAWRSRASVRDGFQLVTVVKAQTLQIYENSKSSNFISSYEIHMFSTDLF